MPTSFPTSAALPSLCQTPKRMSLVVLECCPRMYTRLMSSLVIVATALSPQGGVYSGWGAYTATVRTMRCNGYERRTTFGPNFFVENGKKINTAGPETPNSRSSSEKWEIQTIWSWLVHAGQSERSSGPWCHLRGKGREQSSCARLFAQDTFKVQELGWLRHGPCLRGFAPSVKTDQAFKQIKFWAVDHFHAVKNKKTCKTILCMSLSSASASRV